MVYLPIAVFIAVVLLILALAHVLFGKSTAQRRLDELATTPAAPASPQYKGPADQLPMVTRFLYRRGFTEKMMLEISRAGLRIRPSEWFATVAACIILMGFIGFMLNRGPIIMLVMALLGYAGPAIYLKAKQQKRLSAFNDQIADALSLMGSSLRSGYSFMRALQVVSNEMPAPISEEFIRVIDECNVGVPIEDALQHLVERMRSYDLELVVTAVTIQIQLGGNLAEILDTIAETIRERVRINGEVSTLTAEGRLSGVILVALPVFMAVIIYVLNPRYLQPLWMESFGRMLVIVSVLLIVVGSYVMKKMLEIDF